MKIIDAGYEFITPMTIESGQIILKRIEEIARVCYKSEDRITEDSAMQFVKMLIERGHEAMLEHCVFAVKFICDRSVSHEVVRHRIASFAQESTRYVCSGMKNLLPVDTEDEINYAYQQGMSMKKIADKNGTLSEWAIYKILDKNDIECRSKGSRGVINSEYFKTIDTPEKAYLLGLIFTDGSIRQDLSQVTISQKNGETWWILNMLKDFIQPDIKSLNLCNGSLCNDLFDRGITPNKSFEYTEENANKLWDAAKDFTYDFLRGMLDGDGSIRWFYQKPTSKTKSCHIQFVGNKHIINIVNNFIQNEFNYDAKCYQDKQSPLLYRYVITDSKIGKQFCERLYNNFKFPYGHSKTCRYYNAFDLDIPIQYSEIDNKHFYVIKPTYFNDKSLWIWGNAMFDSMIAYQNMIQIGATPQEARSVLPNSLKTEIVMTANLREWRHFFKLRIANAAHPQMQEITRPLLAELKTLIPIVFDDIEPE